jgi:hypothetical protein
MKHVLILLSCIFLVSCGSLVLKQSELPNPPPSSVTNDLWVVNPAYKEPLEATKSLNLPYVTEAIALILAGFGAYVSARNRKQKRVSETLVENIKLLDLDADNKQRIKLQQQEAGVRDEVRSILEKK